MRPGKTRMEFISHFKTSQINWFEFNFVRDKEQFIMGKEGQGRYISILFFMMQTTGKYNFLTLKITSLDLNSKQMLNFIFVCNISLKAPTELVFFGKSSEK